MLITLIRTLNTQHHIQKNDDVFYYQFRNINVIRFLKAFKIVQNRQFKSMCKLMKF